MELPKYDEKSNSFILSFFRSINQSLIYTYILLFTHLFIYLFIHSFIHLNLREMANNQLIHPCGWQVPPYVRAEYYSHVDMEQRKKQINHSDIPFPHGKAANAGSLLAKRRLRWPSIESALAQLLVWTLLRIQVRTELLQKRRICKAMSTVNYWYGNVVSSYTRQTAVTADFTSKQLLLFVFVTAL